MGYFLSLSKSATSALLFGSEIALLIAGLLLAVGIIEEYRPEPRKGLAKWLVIVGILGEFFGDASVFLFSAHLQSLSDIEVATLNKDASDARQVAGHAIERAGNAENAAQGFKAQIEGLKTTAKGFESQIEGAKATAEAERLERVKLEAQVAPRRLTEAQRGAIATAARRFSGRSVALVSYSIDLEAGVLGKLIGSALSAPSGAGLVVQDNLASITPLGSFLIGIHVDGPASERELIAGLRSILAKQGGLVVATTDTPPMAGASMQIGHTGPKPVVTITIGVKPLKVAVPMTAK